MIIENDGFMNGCLQNACEYDMIIKPSMILVFDLRTNRREGVGL